MRIKKLQLFFKSAFSKRKLWGFLFVLPGLIFFLLFFFYPIVNAIYISFTRWNIFGPKQFLGLGNFMELFHDPDFWNSFKVTSFFTLGTCIFLWITSLTLALLINSNLKFTNLSKIFYFIPSILSITVVSLVWSYMYRRLGLINMFLKSIFNISSIPWLASSKYALLSMVIMIIWHLGGYYMIIFLAGMQGIPITLYEAAKIDGANWWHELIKITLPLLKPTFLFISVISIISCMQAFAPFFVMTGGGPGNSTRALTLKIYEDAFLRLHMGRAAAQAMILFTIIFILSLIQTKIFKSEITY